jgi:GMP reductase
MKREFNYTDVYLIPNRCVVQSRSECSINVSLGKHTFVSPVIAANMRSVVDHNTCLYLMRNNWFYIYHRFGLSLLNFYNYINKFHGDHSPTFSSGSVGVNDDSKRQLQELKDNHIQYDYLCLDIAHAFSPKAKDMISYIKDLFPETFLIAGNVATGDAVQFLEACGADATKCGLSNGKVCETFIATGMGRPQFSTDMECCKWATKPVISDGAAASVGDIAKSLAAGATMKMVGNMMAGYAESAGDVIQTEDGHMKKEYYGSASYSNKIGTHQAGTHIEGKRILVDFKGSMDNLLKNITDGLKSSVSYAGGTDLSALRNVRCVYATPRNW